MVVYMLVSGGGAAAPVVPLSPVRAKPRPAAEVKDDDATEDEASDVELVGRKRKQRGRSGNQPLISPTGSHFGVGCVVIFVFFSSVL